MRRARPLEILVGLLLVVALAETAAIAHLHLRLRTIQGRLADVRAISALNLPVDATVWLALTAEDLDFRLRDLRALQDRADTWISGWNARHDLEPESASLLRGVLRRHVSEWSAARVNEALHTHVDEEFPVIYQGLGDQFYEAAGFILGPELGERLRQDLDPRFEAWTRELGLSPESGTAGAGSPPGNPPRPADPPPPPPER